MALAAIGSVVVAIAILVIGLRIYLGREAESCLATDEVIDFKARASATRTNVFATCPIDYCVPAGDMVSPVYVMGWERLRDYWYELMAAQTGIERLAWDAPRRRATYLQRSDILRFPDIITVEFVSLGEGKSSVAIDSRSRYGSGDFGVNRRRVIAWMGMLRNMMRADQRPGG